MSDITRIRDIVTESAQIAKRAPSADDIAEAVDMLYERLHTGGTIFACGNGGSAAQAQHFAAELAGRYKKERPAYAACALGTDTALLTAWSNDYEYRTAFARELQARAKSGDALVAFSTSGNSQNVIAAVEAAKQQGIITIGILGEGGALKDMVDKALCVSSDDTPRIQEVHLVLLHTIAELLETMMYEQKK